MSLMAQLPPGRRRRDLGHGERGRRTSRPDLFDACRKGDLDGARRINDRLDPLVRVFYAPPFVDMHNRMKEALAMLGRIPAAHASPAHADPGCRAASHPGGPQASASHLTAVRTGRVCLPQSARPPDSV